MNTAQTIPSYKRRNDKHRTNKKLLNRLFLFFILIAIIAYLKSPISKVTEIEITGENLLLTKDIYDKANIQQNMQYFFIKTSTLEEKLLELREVNKVKVSKEFPGKLKIEITEFKPIAVLLLKSENIVPLLENGFLLENNSQYFNLPLITKWQDEELLPILAEQLKGIEPDVFEQISEIQQNPQASNQHRVLIFTKEGYKIHTSLDYLSKKLNLYPTIIDNLSEKESNIGELYLLESMRFEEYDDEGGNLNQDGTESQ